MQDAARIARKLAVLADMGLEKSFSAPVATEAHRVERGAYRVTSQRPAMGTLVSVTAIHASRDTIEEAVGRAFAEMDRLVSLLSRFERSSAVSVLNQQGHLADVPPELSRIIANALDCHRTSRGAFDITVQPLVDLFKDNLKGSRSTGPRADQVVEVLARVGSRYLTASPKAIRFEREGMGVTLDGIAKGYIVDTIAAVLKRHRIKNYLINAGGDIRTAGTKEERQPWTVAVQDPSKQGRFPDRIRVRDAAVATSGGYERCFDAEGTIHHIVDCDTGRSPSRSASVTVLAPTAMTADALATAAFVMHPQAGVAFIDALPRCECLIIESGGGQLKSKRWRSAAQPTKGRRHDE
jgi:thiamine biosynthesis lipoprotein